MIVIVNGEQRKLDGEPTLQSLLLQLGLPTERVAVEVNRQVVRKKDWDTTCVNDSDRIEIVHFVGGG